MKKLLLLLLFTATLPVRALDSSTLHTSPPIYATIIDVKERRVERFTKERREVCTEGSYQNYDGVLKGGRLYPVQPYGSTRHCVIKRVPVMYLEVVGYDIQYIHKGTSGFIFREQYPNVDIINGQIKIN